MKTLTKTRGAILALCGYCVPATAGIFGGVESGMAQFDNVHAASGVESQVSETAVYAAANLGGFYAFANGRTAAVAKLSLQQVTFDQSSELDNRVAGTELGLYHLFGNRQTLLVSAGVRKQDFDDDRRDDTIVTGKLNYSYHLSPTLKINTVGYYDAGTRDTMSGQYRGFGLGATLGWRPHDVIALSLGVNGLRNAYERRITLVEPDRNGSAAEQRSNQGRAATLRESAEMGVVSVSLFPTKFFYLSGSASLRSSRVESTGSVDGTTYTLGLGMKF